MEENAEGYLQTPFPLFLAAPVLEQLQTWALGPEADSHSTFYSRPRGQLIGEVTWEQDFLKNAFHFLKFLFKDDLGNLGKG